MVLSVSVALVWALLCSVLRSEVVHDRPWPRELLCEKSEYSGRRRHRLPASVEAADGAQQWRWRMCTTLCVAGHQWSKLLYKAHSNQGFGLLRLTPALLTTTSWLFLSISICCLFAVRTAESLGFRQLFLLVFVHYWIPWGSGPGLMLGAVSSGICTWKIKH